MFQNANRFSILHLHQLAVHYEASEKNLPDNFNSSSTFQLFFLPLWLIPVQFIEYHHKCWNQIQVFVHPTSLQDSFWNIPLIGCPLKILKILKQATKPIYKYLQPKKWHILYILVTKYVCHLAFNIAPLKPLLPIKTFPSTAQASGPDISSKEQQIPGKLERRVKFRSKSHTLP